MPTRGPSSDSGSDATSISIRTRPRESRQVYGPHRPARRNRGQRSRSRSRTRTGLHTRSGSPATRTAPQPHSQPSPSSVSKYFSPERSPENLDRIVQTILWLGHHEASSATARGIRTRLQRAYECRGNPREFEARIEDAVRMMDQHWQGGGMELPPDFGEWMAVVLPTWIERNRRR